MADQTRQREHAERDLVTTRLALDQTLRQQRATQATLARQRLALLMIRQGHYPGPFSPGAAAVAAGALDHQETA